MLVVFFEVIFTVFRRVLVRYIFATFTERLSREEGSRRVRDSDRGDDFCSWFRAEMSEYMLESSIACNIMHVWRFPQTRRGLSSLKETQNEYAQRTQYSILLIRMPPTRIGCFALAGNERVQPRVIAPYRTPCSTCSCTQCDLTKPHKKCQYLLPSGDLLLSIFLNETIEERGDEIGIIKKHRNTAKVDFQSCTPVWRLRLLKAFSEIQSREFREQMEALEVSIL